MHAWDVGQGSDPSAGPRDEHRNAVQLKHNGQARSFGGYNAAGLPEVQLNLDRWSRDYDRMDGRDSGGGREQRDYRASGGAGGAGMEERGAGQARWTWNSSRRDWRDGGQDGRDGEGSGLATSGGSVDRRAAAQKIAHDVQGKEGGGTGANGGGRAESAYSEGRGGAVPEVVLLGRAGDVRGSGGAIVEGTEAGQTVLLVPIKMMIFIDGTWLYYSLFSRGRMRCPIIKRYGMGWAQEYEIAWREVKAYVAETIAMQLPGRLVDVTRVVVFGSVRAGTSRHSLRVRMFQEMENNAFEVHLLTHTGEQEKCVDISLAVDLMHYATVADGYDIGVLVTGDKVW